MNRIPKAIAAGVALWLLCSGWAAGGARWISLAAGPEGQPPRLQVSATASGLEVVVELYGFYATEYPHPLGPFQQLAIPGCGAGGETGSPELPFRQVLLPVPHGVGVDCQVEWEGPSTVLEHVSAFPRQRPDPDSGRAEEDFDFDPAAYARDAQFPARPFRLVLDGRVHGSRIVGLEISPLLFNPARREVSAYSRIRLRLSFSGTVDTLAEKRRVERQTPFFTSRLPGFDPAKAAEGGAISRSSGTEYLVIVPDALAAAVAPLAQWKRLKGFSTEVVPTSVAGASWSEIRTYLQQEYDANPAFTYLLLVGDHALLPGCQVRPDAYGATFISDLPYSLLDGADYLPDVVLGRLPVQTAAECAAVVDKILAYDRYPEAGAWYQDFLLAAYLQDYNDNNCRADRWFFETGTHLMHFLRDTLGLGARSAATSDHLGCNPYYFRLDSYPHRPAHPDQVPAEDAALFTTAAVSTGDVTTAINDGVGLVFHRDHGSETGWGDPPYLVAQVNGSLANGDRTPVVYSINCLTGAFDYGAGDCFAEAFLKKTGGGAVGLIAATRVSYSGYNDVLAHGLIDATWDGYDADDGGNVYAHTWRPAEALMYAKQYLLSWEGDSEDTLYTCRLFEWFGDPEMMLRLGSQSIVAPVYPPVIPVGLANLTVQCPADGALVAVSDGGVPLGRAYVASGAADIRLDPAPVMPTTLDIVVSGPNLFPHEGTIQVGWSACEIQPIAGTLPATGVGGTRASLNGAGSPEGCDTIGYFQFGLTEDYGSTTAAHYLGHGGHELVVFTRELAGLAPETTYHFRAVAESGGGLVTGEDRTFTTLAITPLAPPGLQSPAGGATGQDPASITLQWTDSNWQLSESASQVRYRRSNESEYSLISVPADATVCPLPGLSNNALYWWNVRAIGDGNLTADSAWANGGTDWAFYTTGADVLLVNGDVGTDYSAYLVEAAQAAGYTYELFMRTSSLPVTLDLLSRFRAVVWSTGNDFANVMTQEEENACRTFLDDGGSLFLAGQDFLYDFYAGNSGNTTAGTFLRDYLAVDWFNSDIGGSNFYAGLSGQDILGGLTLGLGTSPMSTYFDYITPTGSGAVILAVPDTGYAAGVRGGGGAFKTAFMVCPFENISTPAERIALVAGVLAWFLPPPVALQPPDLISPASGATGQPTAPALQWTDLNADPQESYYEVRYKTLDAPAYTLVQTAPDGAALVLDGLLSETTYCWNVRARGNGTTTADSPWANGDADWVFTTETSGPALLSPPSLTAPADAAFDQPADVRLEWTDPNGSPSEVQYEIRYRRLADAEYTVTQVGVNQTALQLAGLELDSVWLWNVRALGNGVATLDSDWANGGADWSFSEGVSGDADRDGDRDAADALLLAHCLAGSLGPESVSLRNADLDGNAVLDGFDLVLLITLP